MKLFLQITKVDVEKREVWGRATQEVPDKSGEIFDYETLRCRTSSSGRPASRRRPTARRESLGNIRAMHGKVAAGKVIAIDFNDVEKAIDIGTEIVDDAEWAKVQKGVYTGFSIGGDYVKKWKDGNLTRYTAKPAEISIVDNPCVPTATFSMVKADGVAEDVPVPAPRPTSEASSEPAADAPPAETPAEDSAPAPAAEEVAASGASAGRVRGRAQADGAEKAAAAPLEEVTVRGQLARRAALLDSLSRDRRRGGARLGAG
jgi:hypothetical protein